MANYQQLKAAIDQVIKANRQKEITGPVLNDTLKAIVNSLGAGYQFMGVATPSTNPGTTDQNVFYIAGQAGTYTNFNSIVLPDGVSILKWNGSWSSETVTVVAGDGVFDISAYKATGGTLATFADLSAALDGGNNIPSALRKGGMSVKFVVQSSDNKYVQCRLMANAFSTTVSDWQCMDKTPVAGSDNLVVSGGVSTVVGKKVISSLFSESDATEEYIKDDGSIDNSNNYRLIKFKVPNDDDFVLCTSGNNSHPFLAKYTDNTYTTIDDILINKFESDFIIKVHLEAGYYAMCWKAVYGTYPNFISSDLIMVGNSIVEKKVEQSYGINLFDTSESVNGKFVNSDGELSDNSAYSATGFIEIEGNTTYYISGKGGGKIVSSPNTKFAIYDQFKKLLTTYNMLDTQTITTPAGAKYARISYLNTAEDILLNEGIYRKTYIPASIIGKYTEAIQLKKVEMAVGKNKFDGSVSYDGKFLSSTGGMNNNSSYAISNLISVKASTQYTLTTDDQTYSGAVGSPSVYMAFYDKDAKLLNTMQIVAANNTFTTPANACYLRFSFMKSLSNIMLNEGTSRGDYFPYSPLGEYTDKFVLDDRNLSQAIDKVKNAIVFKNYLASFDTKPKAYIDDNGVITSINNDAYFTIKFVVNKTDKYIITSPGSYHGILVKYTDNTYSTVETIFAKQVYTNYEYVGTLEQGYYALSWNIGCGDAEVMMLGGDTFNKYILEKADNFGCKIQSFKDFVITNNGWTKVSDDVIQSSANTGLSYKVSYPYITYEDDFILQAMVTPLTADNNGYYSVAIGKYADDGTALIIGNDANGKHVSVIRYDGTTEHVALRQSISDLRFDINKPISVVLEKKNDTITYYTLKISDCAGNVVSVDRITGYVYPMTNDCAGLAHGVLTAYTKAGTWQIEKLSFGYAKDAVDIKLLIAGHSFVEGNNSTVNDKDKRLATLITDEIGLEKCLVFGLGGGNVGMLDSIYHQISWYSSTRYALIVLGTNDADNATTTTKMQQFNDKLIGLSIKPVWLTVIPERDGNGSSYKPTVDAYIRSHFNYIDVNNVFLNADGTVNKSMFADTVHPTIQGYQKMFNVVKSQASEFWEI